MKAPPYTSRGVFVECKFARVTSLIRKTGDACESRKVKPVYPLKPACLLYSRRNSTVRSEYLNTRLGDNGFRGELH